MWISYNGSLCYFSPKFQKRLVYIDAGILGGAQVTRITDNCAMPHAFSLTLPSSDDGMYETVHLACETAKDLDVWVEQLGKIDQLCCVDVQTLRFSAGLFADLRKFQLQVRNRRENLGEKDTHCTTTSFSLYMKTISIS